MDNLVRYGFRVAKGRFATQAPIPVKMKVASGYQAAPGAVNVPLRIGDPVGLVNDGTVALAAAGGGAAIFGVIVEVFPYWDGTKMVFGDRLPGGTAPGTTAIDRFSYVGVVNALGTVFEIDVDDTVNTTLQAYQAHINANADHAFSAVANVGAFPKLDISTVNTTNTLQWRILGVSDSVENQDYSGANVKLYVTANVTSEAPVQATGV